MTTELVYSTATATAALGWDELVADDLVVTGRVLEECTVRGDRITLLKFFSEETPTGYGWEVSSVELERCDDECRYEMCEHGRWDRSYRFDTEDEARGRYSYLSNYEL